MKTENYKIGALKRNLNKGKVDFKTGELIAKVNASKQNIRNKNKPQFTKTRLAIMGLI